MKTSKLSGTSELTRLVPRNKVAFYLGVCTRTVKRYEKNKQLTPHIINSRLTAYPEGEVMALISNARQVGVMPA